MPASHDNFKAKLASLSPATDERCECSRKDTVQYHILDCPVFEPQRPKRIALVEITGGKIWPEAARFNLVFSAKVFSLFNTFRKKVLSIKDLVQPELPEFLMMGMGCNLLRSTHFQTRWKWLCITKCCYGIDEIRSKQRTHYSLTIGTPSCSLPTITRTKDKRYQHGTEQQTKYTKEFCNE
ncbi:histone-lysine N-methyltransferase SETMAR-like [Vespula maculifrons]|uniref:Histone-lysine N-methyltransferase SETMAR-like n=1 Tax=Vespula maculifrons TaxID=7453 RepID=A0ABD2CFG1_VESMC